MAKTPSPASFYRADGYCADNSVGYLMRRLINSIAQAADRRLEPDGMTQVQWGPLFMLARSRASTVAELARELQTDPGAMTRLLDRLEAKGLCQRQRCTDDRRVVRVGLTPEGEKAAALVPAALAQTMNETLAGFSRGEWQALTEMLKRMLANADAFRAAAEAEPAAAPALRAVPPAAPKPAPVPRRRDGAAARRVAR